MRQMTRTATWGAVLTCAALSIACADPAQAERGGAQAPASISTQTAEAREAADAAEYRAYRLSTTVLTRVEAATRSFMQGIKSDPTYRAHLAAQREYDALDEKDSRTEAEEARMEQLKKTLDASPYVHLFGDSDGEASLDEIEAEIAKMPAVANALKANGVAPRDYVKFIVVLVQATVVAGLQAVAGGQASTPEAQLLRALADGPALAEALGTNFVAPENVTFVTANRAAVDRFMQTMQELRER